MTITPELPKVRRVSLAVVGIRQERTGRGEKVPAVKTLVPITCDIRNGKGT